MPNATVFLSDIHLCEAQTEITRAFVHFIEHVAPQFDSVYILGDLFDYWIGDDCTTAYHEYIIQKLHTLSTTTPWYFQPGNRDFLIGQAFAEAAGCTLLPEIVTHKIQGHRILLTHGDLLVQADYGYRMFRYCVQSHLMKKAFLSLPATWRLRIAAYLRSASRQATQKKTAKHFTTSIKPLQAELNAHQANMVIYGHIHRFSITYNSVPHYFLSMSLADWRPGKRPSFLTISPSESKLERLSTEVIPDELDEEQCLVRS
jgi:UDP-2,3-diacylglucosamine hydrolase